MFSKNLNFSDALKLSAGHEFSLIIKPVGDRCNLNCDYCYYKSSDCSKTITAEEIMSDDIVEELIFDYIVGSRTSEIVFCWHGGEPLLAGIKFFRKVLAFQAKHSGYKNIINTIQTNGTLINYEWAHFFATNNFLVGISIDGPETIHDYYRKGKGGKGSFKAAMRGLANLKKAGVSFNTLTVVTDHSQDKGREIYQFLKDAGSIHMQFLPAADFVEGEMGIVNPAPWNPAPDGYGKFMADIFDVWHKNDIGTIFVQRFETILACYAQYPVRLCSFATVCGDVPVVEKNGDIFRCDHYVRDYKPAGNIKEVRISRAINSADQLEFGINKRDSLPEECLSCEFYFACKGGCPKHRYPEGAGDKSGKYYLCEGKKLFLRHTGDRFERLATQNRLV